MRKFKEPTHDLYYHDTSVSEMESDPEDGTILVTMVVENTSNFSNVDYAQPVN